MNRSTIAGSGAGWCRSGRCRAADTERSQQIQQADVVVYDRLVSDDIIIWYAAMLIAFSSANARDTTGTAGRD